MDNSRRTGNCAARRGRAGLASGLARAAAGPCTCIAAVHVHGALQSDGALADGGDPSQEDLPAGRASSAADRAAGCPQSGAALFTPAEAPVIKPLVEYLRQAGPGRRLLPARPPCCQTRCGRISACLSGLRHGVITKGAQLHYCALASRCGADSRSENRANSVVSALSVMAGACRRGNTWRPRRPG
jgi:hypothetical protein